MRNAGRADDDATAPRVPADVEVGNQRFLAFDRGKLTTAACGLADAAIEDTLVPFSRSRFHECGQKVFKCRQTRGKNAAVLYRKMPQLI